MQRIASLVLSAVLLSLLAAPAAAKEYRVPILVDTEDDILEMYYADDISVEERDLLLRLLEDPLDINEASRNELYDLPGLTYDLVDRIIAAREEKRFSRVSNLKKIPGIAPDIYRQLQPFVEHVPKRSAPKKGVSKDVKGTFRYQITDRIREGDTDLPEMSLRGRVQGLDGFKAGFAVTLENGVGPTSWRDAIATPSTPLADLWKVDSGNGRLQCDRGDGVYDCGPGSAAFMVFDDKSPLERYLRTDGEHYRTPWPKIYVSVVRDRWRAVAGSYKIGFGQRLVLDNTGRDKPHGFIGDDSTYGSESGVRLSPDFMGLAGSYDFALGGRLSLEVTPFFSWWRYDAYQIYLNHEDEFTGERESYVVVSGIPGTPYSRKHYYVTLPQAYDELLGGGNVSLKWGSRSHVGITGFGSTLGFHLGDGDTVFTTSSRYPADRTVFAAFGLDAAVEIGPDTTVFAEMAATDQLSAEAMAAIVRAVWQRKPLEIDASVRYLGDDYDNPHARGISMSDQWLGNADRGELGLRLDASWKVAKWLRLRLGEDVWRAARWNDPNETTSNPAEKTHLWRNETYLRVDGYPFNWWTVGVYALYRDNDLESSGWTWTDPNGDVEGVDYSFNGTQWRVGAQTSFIPLKWMRLDLYYQLKFFHEKKLSLEKELQKGHYTYFKIRVNPVHWLTVSARAKYFKGELAAEEGATGEGEEYGEGYLQLEVRPYKGLAIGGRGAMRGFLHVKADGETPPNEYFWRATVAYSF
ncbi:MAG: helix-hairpin-helix domain-containing protein [Pseudomonadota bacterium]